MTAALWVRRQWGSSTCKQMTTVPHFVTALYARWKGRATRGAVYNSVVHCSTAQRPGSSLSGLRLLSVCQLVKQNTLQVRVRVRLKQTSSQPDTVQHVLGCLT